MRFEQEIEDKIAKLNREIDEMQQAPTEDVHPTVLNGRASMCQIYRAQIGVLKWVLNGGETGFEDLATDFEIGFDALKDIQRHIKYTVKGAVELSTTYQIAENAIRTIDQRIKENDNSSKER